ncbi:hypothetical protein [Haladaptatus sp. YSMS36]|uniref:hypothetical protein n=1 Tax=Haladaptatus sp. YSMS36 TaxID=3033384 RepID=UPI0023E84503|nr:hypothetical protein [Haladaptatus sp. YSMS36]
MSQSVWDVAAIDDDIRAIATGELLDFRTGVPHEGEPNGSLPPAWDVGVESYVIGYEPVGATSIGTESERRWHTRLSYFRTPADRLSLLNEGRHPSDGTLGARLARLDKKRITQAYCSVLDVSRFQRDEAVRAMLLLNLDDFGQQKRIEKVALTVIRIIVNYNRFSHLKKIEAERISESETFKRLAKEADLDKRTMTRLSKKIKQRLVAVEFFERDFEKADLRHAHFQHKNKKEVRSLGREWPPKVLE